MEKKKIFNLFFIIFLLFFWVSGTKFEAELMEFCQILTELGMVGWGRGIFGDKFSKIPLEKEILGSFCGQMEPGGGDVEFLGIIYLEKEFLGSLCGQMRPGGGNINFLGFNVDFWRG